MIQSTFAGIINGTHIQVSPLSNYTPTIKTIYDIDSIAAKTDLIPCQKVLSLKLVSLESSMQGTLNLYHNINDLNIDCGVIPNIHLGKFGDNSRFKVYTIFLNC